MSSFLVEPDQKNDGDSVMMESGIWSALPDEILLAILRRLPLSCFLRFRTVCKAWNIVLANPASFSIFSSRPTFYSKPLAIFRTQQASSDSVLAPGRQAILAHSDEEEDRVSMRLRWHRIELDFLLVDDTFISSHAGLVLVRRLQMQYLVLNPVMPVSILLPTAPIYDGIPEQPIFGLPYAIAAVFRRMNPTSSSLKVISARCLGSHKTSVPTFLYDSDTREWKRLGPLPFLKNFSIGNSGIGAMCKNICYWSTIEDSLNPNLLAFDFEQETWQILRTKRAPEYLRPIYYALWEWQNQLMMIAQDNLRITLFKLLEDNCWYQFHIITQHANLTILLGFAPLNCSCLGSMLFFLNGAKNKVLAFDLVSKAFTISNLAQHSPLISKTFISFHPNLDAI